MKEDYIWNDITKRYVLRKNKIGRQLEENYVREKYIETMKNKSPDDYEPIYFESFQAVDRSRVYFHTVPDNTNLCVSGNLPAVDV